MSSSEMNRKNQKKKKKKKRRGCCSILCAWLSCAPFKKCANRLCPKDKLLLEKVSEKRQLEKRLESFAILFVMIWTIFQLAIFIVLLIVFLFSDNNYFMRKQDCCTATEYLQSDGLPLEVCSDKQCQLYNFQFDGDRDLIQDRPRVAMDGEHSFMFEYEGGQHCCNMDARSNACCNSIPYGMACGGIMWCAGFSAVCAMFMTQVILQGFYSYTARNKPYWVMVGTFVGIFLRVFIFCIIFYLFFFFMFLLIFFWVSMFFCDNPYAFDWWKFGYWYVWYFFANAKWIWTQGVTSYDGNMNMDSLLAAHTSCALGIDIFFAFIYFILYQIKDKHGFPYFHLAFFHL